MWKIEEGVCLIFLLLLALFDLRYKKVPTTLLILFFVFGALFCVIRKEELLWKGMGIALGLCFCGISKLTKEAIGYGDSIGILILGIYLGVFSLVAVLFPAFLLAGFLGWLYQRKKKSKKAIPFFPFLLIGVLVEYILWRN